MTTPQGPTVGRSATLPVAAVGTGLAMAVYITPRCSPRPPLREVVRLRRVHGESLTPSRPSL